MKWFLLMAGNNYYPGFSTEDWVGAYETYDEAQSQVEELVHTRTITKGKRKGEEEVTSINYIVNKCRCDWYKIVDLRDWVDKR